MRQPPSLQYRFGDFCLDVAERHLLRRGVAIPLAPKVFDTLLLLVENAGHLIEKEEFMKKLWPDTFVGDDALARNISIVRRAVGGSSESQSVIATVPKRGYRFVAEVAGNGLEREDFQTADLWHIRKALQEEAPRATQQAVAPALSPPAKSNGNESSAVVIPLVAPAASIPRVRMVPFALFAVVLGALAGVITFYVLRPSPSRNLLDINLTKLTTSGAVTGVAISADGRYVAYAKLEGEKQGLWLHQIASRSDVQILSAGAGFHGLTFSPDGNYIYFVRSDEQNTMFKYLSSMPVLGGPAKKLFTDVDSPVSFSPDGRWFVYEHCVEGRDDIELRMANADGSEDHVLAILQGASRLPYQPGPNWSPDGRTIAVPVLQVGARREWALKLVTVADGSVRTLFARAHPIGRPVWLRVDSLLEPLYDPVGQHGQLWTISIPEGKMRRFTNDLTSYGSILDDYGFPLDLSRDGKSLVALATTQAAKVWGASAGGPSQAHEITKEWRPLFMVTEAADGRLWATNGGVQLWVMNPDGSHGTAYGDYHAIDAIAACGRYMILAQGESGQSTLTRLDADAKNPTHLVSGSVFGPFCLPDGKFVYYASAPPQKLWRIPIEGGTAVEIAQIMGDQFGGAPSISPDGSRIAYVYTKFGPALGPSIAVIGAAGGPPVKTIPVAADGWAFAWSPDGKGIEYLLNRNGVTNLWEQPLSGGKSKQVTKFTSGLIFDFSWSFDRKRLFLTQGEITSDAVLLNNFR